MLALVVQAQVVQGRFGLEAEVVLAEDVEGGDRGGEDGAGGNQGLGGLHGKKDIIGWGLGGHLKRIRLIISEGTLMWGWDHKTKNTDYKKCKS